MWRRHRADNPDSERKWRKVWYILHQKLVSKFTRIIGNYVEAKGGECEVIPAPFAVNLNADDEDWVEPDLSVICDKKKLTERGCKGAPDFIIEVVSSSSRKMDYIKKLGLYSDRIPFWRGYHSRHIWEFGD